MSVKSLQQNIPSGWQNHALSDLCDSLDNRRIPITKSDRVSGDVPYYGATGIIDYVHGNTFDEEILLIGEDGADWSPYASKAFIVRGKSWVNNHAHVLKCKAISSHEYLEQYLNWKNLDVYTTGGTRKKLNKEVLMNIPICLPESKTEQQKIAEILRAVDEDIAKTQEVIEVTEKLKLGLMQQLFTRGIGHTKFKETKIGEIPEGWEVNELKDISTKIGDGLHGTPEYSDDSEYYFINGNNISEREIKIYPETKKISIEEHNIHKKELTDRSILLSINGTIGNIGFYKGEKVALGKSVAYINCNNKINKEFVAYQLETERIHKHFTKELTGTTIKNLSLGTIRQTLIFVPKVEEQQEIAKILSAVDGKISVNKKLKEKLTLLKKGLMQDLLSGKVRTI